MKQLSKSTHALKMRRTRGFNNKTPDEISAVIPSMNNNTDNKKRIANMANIQINNHIAAKAETGRVIYRVDLTFRDGETATESFFAEISERPKLPQDPPENISVTTGCQKKHFNCQIGVSKSRAVSAPHPRHP